MPKYWLFVAGAGAAMAFTLTAAKRAPTEIEIPSNGIVRGTVEGKPAVFLVAADGTSGPVLRRSSALSYGFKDGMIKVGAKFGSKTIFGYTDVVHYEVDGVPEKRRGSWFDVPLEGGADLTIGPRALPHDKVLFRLRDPQPGEKSYRFVTKDNDWQGISVRSGNYNIQFDPLSPVSYSSASAGAFLADEYAGHWTGEQRNRPIKLGVARPVRRLSLQRPMVLGPLSMAELDVRTTDYGSTAGITAEEPDPSEIVVTAKDPKNRLKHSWIHLGRDVLSKCSSILFDKKAKAVELRCLG